MNVIGRGLTPKKEYATVYGIKQRKTFTVEDFKKAMESFVKPKKDVYWGYMCMKIMEDGDYFGLLLCKKCYKKYYLRALKAAQTAEQKGDKQPHDGHEPHDEKGMTGMREIRFRGKRIDTGEWVYGAFIPDALESTHNHLVTWGFIRIINRKESTTEMVEVDRESVSQYTGLKDANGRDVYEGDIVRHGYSSVCGDFYNNGVVVYFEPNGAWEISSDGEPKKRLTCGIVVERHIEVIGNVHDTKEGDAT